MLAEERRRRFLDRYGIAQPGRRYFDRRRRPHLSRERLIHGDVGGRVAAEDERGRPAVAGTLVQFLQQLLALLFGEPHDLERIVPFDQAVLVVVDRFTGPREQPGRRVVLAQNHLCVGIGTLQRDANRHLVDGAARERIGAAERLRAEQHVKPERAALPHETVEQQ